MTEGHSDTKERRDEIYPCAREDDRNSTGDKDEQENTNNDDVSSGHNEQNGTEEWRDEDYSCDSEDEAADRNSYSADEDVNNDDSHWKLEENIRNLKLP